MKRVSGTLSAISAVTASWAAMEPDWTVFAQLALAAVVLSLWAIQAAIEEGRE